MAAILVEKETRKKIKKYILIGASASSLGVLFFFKYFNFASESVVSLLSVFSIQLNPITLRILLPVGISFYTFQTLSYVIDVYKGDVPAEHHFGYYAAFVSFFPQLVAGPIERTSNLLPQIKAKHTFDYSEGTYGLKLMAWGFFKKIVIADTLANCVSVVYDSPHNFSGFSLLLATLFFTIQIYCDFSGYSDIAIGTAKLFGINLMTNFKSPYFAQSIKEFWSRWHISLSTWFKDYIYIPLGGNRVGKVRHSINLLITFLVSGLWHGANWTFVVWGGIHGVAQAVESIIIPKQKQTSTGIMRWVRIIATFLFSSFAWIFFVANSLEDAAYVICNMFAGITAPLSYLQQGFLSVLPDKVVLLTLIVSILILVFYDFYSLKTDVIHTISSKKKAIRWLIYIAFMIWMIMSVPVVSSTEFIYFQF